MHVLLAQESLVIRTFYRRVLASLPHLRATWEDLESVEALGRWLKNVPDPDTILLLDGNLKGLDLPVLMGFLGEKGYLKRVSVLLLVSERQVAMAERAVRLGAAGFLVRPFTDESLASKIEEAGLRCARERNLETRSVLQNALRAAREQESLPPLLRLPSTVLGELISRCASERYEPGMVIVKPGDRVEALRFVTRGEVEVRSSDDPELRTRGLGECFAEQAFVLGEPARITVTALTGVTAIAVSKEAVDDLARRHPSVVDFLKCPEPCSEFQEGDSDLTGTLSSLSFADLLQFLNSSRKTGVLILVNGAKKGRIYLEQGDVTDARADGEWGEGVFRRLGGWLKARFEFKGGPTPGTRTIYRSTISLLMDLFLPNDGAPAGEVDFARASRATAV